jgi:hypothetical protein
VPRHDRLAGLGGARRSGNQQDEGGEEQDDPSAMEVHGASRQLTYS